MCICFCKQFIMDICSKYLVNTIRTRGARLWQSIKDKVAPKPTLHEGIVLGIGNPLLDITAHVEEKFLEKYQLKSNNAIIRDERHLNLYEEILAEYKCALRPGGSAQNTMRTIQWILKKPHLCTFFGCVGNDIYAQQLRDVAKEDGLNVAYQVTDKAPTGTCCVLITATDRSLVADLGASEMFTINFLGTKKARDYLKKARFFYTPGFFLPVSSESLLFLARYAHEHGHKFIYNLSASFIMRDYPQHLAKLMPFVDIVFGNESETIAFARAFDLDGKCLREIAVQMSQMPQKLNRGPRVVIVTQGSGPILVVVGSEVTEIPVTPLAKHEIVDTNGCGDAFTGGFISQLVLGKSYKTCIECGMYSAKYIISRVGCTFGEESNFKPSE